jgi:hypothetical protein
MPQLYEEVTLTRDVPEYNLKRGDSAILVDTVPHPKGGEEGYVLELFNDAEESVNVVIVPKSAIQEEEKVFISYAWREDSDEIADKLQDAFQKVGITIIRDKTHLGYKGDIKKFMEWIGQGNCVLLVISDKYLKSPNCMFELIEIAKNGNFYDRIFPIVLPDAKLYNAQDRLKYIQYWETQSKELEETMKQGGLANLQGINDALNLYNEIRNQIARLTDTLKNMNTLNLDFHRQEDFETVIQAVQKQLNISF